MNSMKTIELAFYKHSGTWIDKIIKFWTFSKYSHVEIIINDKWYSTSPREQRLRSKFINPKSGHWDIYTIEVHPDELNTINQKIRQELGKRYDFIGIIFSQVFPLKRHHEDRWFCSEFVSYCFDLEHPHTYSPGKLYKKLKDRLKLNESSESSESHTK